MLASLIATVLVFCAPGYPGSSAEAKPAMDAFARALSSSAGLPAGGLAATYQETDAGGVSALQADDAGLALVTLPFFLEHEEALRLTARLLAAPKDGGAVQRWTLWAAKGADASLAGFTVQSSAAPARFVHALAPSTASAGVTTSGAVLSGLRKASSGDPLALLLDGPQAAALPQLPFAAQLAKLSESPEVPVAIVATVGKRLDEKQWKPLEAALLRLGADAGAKEGLDGVRMSGFVPLDGKALAAARAAWKSAK